MLLLASCAGTQNPGETLEQNITFTGIVEAGDMDEAGNVTATSIWTNKEEYEVAPEGKGPELLKYVNKTVKATGTVTTKEDGAYKVITVTSFEEAQPVKEEVTPDTGADGTGNEENETVVPE